MRFSSLSIFIIVVLGTIVGMNGTRTDLIHQVSSCPLMGRTLDRRSVLVSCTHRTRKENMMYGVGKDTRHLHCQEVHSRQGGRGYALHTRRSKGDREGL